MEHNRITLWRHPCIWVLDKCATGVNAPKLYIVAFIPTIFMLIGFVANLWAIFQLEEQGVGSERAVIILGFFLFVFGIINLAFLHLITQAKVRLGREGENYRILHRDIIEKIRDYRSGKRLDRTESKTTQEEAASPTAREIKREIHTILELFLKSYLYRVHPWKSSAVIKYKDPKNDKLIPIRVGNDASNRNSEPEPLGESYIYQALTATGKKLQYIYVKNLDKPDNHECTTLGVHLEDVKKRAQGKYSTFIALPIRSGESQDVSGQALTAHSSLGMLGIDLKREYGFGNFEEPEWEYLACFVDMMSELVQDLIDAEKTEYTIKPLRR